MSQDEHRVAEAVEAVALAHSLFVAAQDKLTAGKRAHQHKQRGARQVEVGEQHIHGTEGVAGADEEASSAGKWLDERIPRNLTVLTPGGGLGSDGFERAHGGCADSDDASTGGTRGVDAGGGGGIQLDGLAVHRVRL